MQRNEVARGVSLARLILNADVVVDSDPGCRHVDDLRVDGGLVDSVAEALQEISVGHKDPGPLGGAGNGWNVAVHVEVLVGDHVDPNPVGVEPVQEDLGRREDVIVDVVRVDAQLLLHGIACLSHVNLSILVGKHLTFVFSQFGKWNKPCDASS